MGRVQRGQTSSASWWLPERMAHIMTSHHVVCVLVGPSSGRDGNSHPSFRRLRASRCVLPPVRHHVHKR